MSSIKATYDEQGFVVVPGLIAPEDWNELEAACQRVIKKTRDGKWPHRRVVGKQFPPYDIDNPDSWGVQHIMHPQLGEPSFGKWYTSDRFLNVAKELLVCSDMELQLGRLLSCLFEILPGSSDIRSFITNVYLWQELFNLLINPLNHDFALRWHRDDVSEKATEDEERKALQIWHHGVRYTARNFRDTSPLIPQKPGSMEYVRSSEYDHSVISCFLTVRCTPILACTSSPVRIKQ